MTFEELKISRQFLNAIDDGWCVKKKEGLYIFTKRKSKEKQVYEEKYLEKFIQKYFNLN